MIYRDKKPFWHCKEDVIRDWEEMRLRLVIGGIPPRVANGYIAREKAEHRKNIEDALSGAYHKTRERHT